MAPAPSPGRRAHPFGELVTPRTPPPLSHHLTPRLASALFRRYLRACIAVGPDQTLALAGARPEATLAEAQRTRRTTNTPAPDQEAHA
ncbi:hypothetical protein ACFC0M_06150 [Streptomyces sp. NPDC056149]|uniref:hypothetical protein n=1 Tax=Streptomyces sp. NPDC056149 TaxID=3345728 RepID=UPI0035DC33B0